MKYEKEIRYIAKRLSFEERLTALAEEAAELTQAALKLRRALECVNPTPKDPWDCLNNLQEEIRDVIGCAVCTDLMIPHSPVEDYIPKHKLVRWCERLEKRDADNDQN